MCRGFLFIFLFSSLALGAERLGEVEVSDLLIQPTMTLKEERQGGFALDPSYIQFRWLRKATLGAVLTLGTLSLSQKAQWYPESSEGFGVVEAYGYWRSSWGEWRWGMIPILFGHEGAIAESQYNWRPSYFYEKRWGARRDFGLSYQMRYRGFFTDFAFHNGESGANTDASAWVTGRWGWMGQRGGALGISGSGGKTKSVSTLGAQPNLSFFQADRDASMRIGGIFFRWKESNSLFLAEGFRGRVTQGSVVTEFGTGHIDFSYDFSPSFRLLLRGEELRPNLGMPGGEEKRSHLGFSIFDQHDVSVLTLWLGSREGSGERENELLASWKLTPLF